MYRCLNIAEILRLIFEFAKNLKNNYGGSRIDKKTLASLARTCHSFSSLALDALWHDLDSFNPILHIFPVDAYAEDDRQWPKFHQYAQRVRTIRGDETGASPVTKPQFMYSFRNCPKSCLPLLPNLTELYWYGKLFTSLEHSNVWLLEYISGPSVTRLLFQFSVNTPDAFTLLPKLPQLCPNVTSFVMKPGFDWESKVGCYIEMLSQWQRLQCFQTSAISQPIIDQLAVQRTLHTVHLEYGMTSHDCAGKISDAVWDLTLSADGTSESCAMFFESIYASPFKFRLSIDVDTVTDFRDTLLLLPRRLNTARLHSLIIQPFMVPKLMPLDTQLVIAVSQFTALHNLDLNYNSTAKLTDADYAHLASSLVSLRTLKIGTACMWRRPISLTTVKTVIELLRCCEYLETLHIIIDGSVPPPSAVAKEDGTLCISEDMVHQRWGVSNRNLCSLNLGWSPIKDAVVNVMATCFTSIMPHLTSMDWIETLWGLVWEKMIDSGELKDMDVDIKDIKT